MRLLKWVTDRGLESVFMVPLMAITLLCSCGGGGEYRPFVIKNDHGQSMVIFNCQGSREKVLAWVEDNKDKKIVSVSFDWHGSTSVVVYEEPAVPKKPKCKECGQPIPCEESKP